MSFYKATSKTNISRSEIRFSGASKKSDREPVIVPLVEPAIASALDPVIVPTREPVIVPTLLVREPVMVPANDADEIMRVSITVATMVCTFFIFLLLVN